MLTATLLKDRLRRPASNNNGSGNGRRHSDAERPFRSELFSVGQLERHAKSLAGWHRLAVTARARNRLLLRLHENQSVLANEYERMIESVRRGTRGTPAAEWFLDNYHLIEEQIRTARLHLPRRYQSELPQLANGPSAGFPRVYDIALELISHVDGRVDAASVRAFVAAYESVSPLRLGELWAIPIMLRLALLENVRRVVLRIAAGRLDTERAGLWVQKMLDAADQAPANVVLVLADLVRENPPLTAAFAAEFASRLRGRGAILAFPVHWLENRLDEEGRSLEQMFQEASQDQAANQVSIGNSITSLRFLHAADWHEFVESLSAVEQALRRDPSGIYPTMDFATRDRYRHVVERLARRSLLSEEQIAEQAVELAAAPANKDDPTESHVGFYLISRGRHGLERAVGTRFSFQSWIVRHLRADALGIYILCALLLTAIVTGAIVVFAARHGMSTRGLIALGVLAAVCASQFGLAVVQSLLTLLVRPRSLPRLDFSKGIPDQFRTIVAVPTMLTDQETADDLLEELEVRFLANRDAAMHFALLTDFRDAAGERAEEDDALLSHMSEGIAALNAKYDSSGGFFLFHRPRRWNPGQGVWMGWERKRGKIENFNIYLRDPAAGKDLFSAIIGPVERLQDVKYVITLDSDTQLPRDAGRLLVGTMAHPLNRPRFDEKTGRVIDGYGILQPRVAISMPSAGRSRFAQLFSGDPGIDPYTRAVSDVYQDAFEEGSFVGKGIYDVDAITRSVGGRFPENAILSHDLLEGLHARSGLVSDVLLIEEFPPAYPADVSRRHRWIRGDWQIAPWLLPLVPGGAKGRVRNPISALSRWKIADNLRRSLVPVAVLAWLASAPFLPGGPLPYFAAILGMWFGCPVIAGLGQLVRHPSELPRAQHWRLTARQITRQLAQELFAFACLPYDAFISLDAILRTTTRMIFTRRRMLEWRTARDAQATARTDLFGFYVSMWVQPLATLAILGLERLRPAPEAAPLAVIWLVSPFVAWWLSQPLGDRRRPRTEADTQFLSAIARRTWRYFEALVGATDNHLPPDNYQDDPPVGAAHRTSPTNIGLALLANLSAYDFSFIPLDTLIERTSLTLGTMDRLQRYRGHFYNWYDTRSLEPIRPLYISTVDSGNLSGHLLTLAAGFSELADEKIVLPSLFNGLRATLRGAADNAAGSPAERGIKSTLDELRQALHEPTQNLSGMYALLQRLAGMAEKAVQGNDLPPASELRWWLGALAGQCRQFAAHLTRLAPWVDVPAPTARAALQAGDLRKLLARLEQIPTLSEVARLETTLLPELEAALKSDATAADWLNQLRAAIAEAGAAATEYLSELSRLAARCREFADVEYEFLYDSSRRLMTIGYNVAEHRIDPSYYDLLASEARLASFVAIAQGKLPQEHWFCLSRLLTNYGGRPVLLSWSGSMFEYLMPLLVMPAPPRTLLDETCRAVVRRQIDYGRERGVPWGISESGFSQTDAQLNYQYRAFGVPGLGFKRGLADDLVIAPYASAMALMVEPEPACTNLHRLADEGRFGMYGFFEAIDYTPSRLPPGQDCAVVRSFMSHHQGMSLLALNQLLLDGPMVRRFESEASFRATELLLHERVPRTDVIFPHPAETSEVRPATTETGGSLRVFNTPNTPAPEVHLLSNGRYHVMLTGAGGGYSRWGDLDITRWREDSAMDCWGTFCYLRDAGTGDSWSATYQPTLKRGSTYEAIFSQGRAEYRRRDGDIDTHVEIAVSPEDDIELRRFTITNRSETRRTIEWTSYAEVVLASAAADETHTAFSNLFVQTKILPQRQAILCTRRPRSSTERPPWMVHLATVIGPTAGDASYETGRAAFIGRGRSPVEPAALHGKPGPLAGGEGAVLDPIVAIRNTLILEPDQTVAVNLVTGVAETEQAALALVEKYHDPHLAERVLELAWTHSQVVLRQLDVSEIEAQAFGRMAGAILYSHPVLRASGSIIARNRRGQSGLWGYGISGDLPIVLLKIGEAEHLQLVQQLVAAHAYWRLKGLSVDLVIWNEDTSGYRQALHDAILGIIASRARSNVLDKPGGIFLRRVDQMSEEDKILMQAVARIVLCDTAGTLAEQLARRSTAAPPPRFHATPARRNEPVVHVEPPRHDLKAFNGIGGFTNDGREYVVTIAPDKPTPAPWVNVLANPNFGSVVSESGSAYTWRDNAQLFRITPWNGDWITDISGESFYIRDEETGRFFSPTPQPAPGPWPYTTRHGFGYTIFEYTEGEISTEMSTYVAMDAPVKFFVIKLRNNSGRLRRFSITGFFELALGQRRLPNLPHIVTELDPRTGAIFARNSYNSEFADRVVFLDCSESRRTITGDRVEFLGRNGRPAQPACMGRTRLSGRVGAGFDPCAAMQASIDVAEGQQAEVAFILGCGADMAEARDLVTRFRGAGPASAALERVWDYWKRTLGAVFVETPDPSLNFLANGWLLYQVLACRMWGRSGFYQSGGAFGFRDQLQDASALVHAEPRLLREHLLRSAARQFKEGDVQHWWHPPHGRGVRTHISDDYLWLPLAVCRYIRCIGDTGVLDEKLPFLQGRALKPDEESYYDLPATSEESATLYEHCVRAIRNGLRYGDHGLPLMGAGDWNDGMNLVGEHGRGESVWLGFFLYKVLSDFAELARLRQDAAIADLCTSEAGKLRVSLDRAWDGDWYKRAWFDDGEPLGSAVNAECRIDSLPQSWSILSGVGDPARARQAMEAVMTHLVNTDLGVIRLFEPPFNQSSLNPGYIKGYVPGVRENGGQYTHGAIWAVMAFAESGDARRAWELFNLINPIHHGDSEARIRQYKVEPYVVAADIYTNLQHAGRGGWTWYTGSAGWMYRLITESLLGLRLEVDHLRMQPLMPANWESFQVHYRYRQTLYHIRVRRLSDGAAGVSRVLCDGVEAPDKSIRLVDDHQEHHAEVELGVAASKR
ncbi:MAG TPA: glucoamylase family protein [Tepidisphaeraceae bacterium]|nr:glucoamylase family protein [Tepidisphaeraceae bacterium]